MGAVKRINQSINRSVDNVGWGTLIFDSYKQCYSNISFCRVNSQLLLALPYEMIVFKTWIRLLRKILEMRKIVEAVENVAK